MTTFSNSASKTISIAEKVYVYTIGGEGTGWRPVLASPTASFEWSRGAWYKIHADNSKPISAYWTSKRLDFGDQFPDYADMWKTIDRIQIEYIDETASTPITVGISNDGGLTWAYQIQSLGIGDKKQKVADFYYRDSELSTGLYFNIRIESVSSSTTFIWTGFYVHFEPRGEYFEV